MIRSTPTAQRAAVHGWSTSLPLQLLLFYSLLALPLLFLHWPLLHLPFFWDELGQFVPSALDLYRTGSWIAHSTVPNIHPPGVELYLAVCYHLFGFSIAVTRIAMLAMAGLGLLLSFLVAIELSRGAPGLPAFFTPLLLTVSPLFFTQSMMAQLDMPAMVFTMLVVFLFLKDRYLPAALASVLLVLMKETGLATPLALAVFLIWKRRYRPAAWFTLPVLALGLWLLLLHRATGFWMGNPAFEHYNVGYSLNPIRLNVNVLRRIYYLFFAEFRFVATFSMLLVIRVLLTYLKTERWVAIGFVCAANLAVVTVFGGAALERYLLPVLPFLYILTGLALSLLSPPRRLLLATLLTAGLAVNLFWNPSYPFPFENNYAMVDFIGLQKAGAEFLEDRFPHARIATSWPYSGALRNPDFGYVHRPFKVLDIKDFRERSISALARSKYDLLVVYTQTWAPADGVLRLPWVRLFLARFYEYSPELDDLGAASLGLRPVASWTNHGQSLTVYRHD